MRIKVSRVILCRDAGIHSAVGTSHRGWVKWVIKGFMYTLYRDHGINLVHVIMPSVHSDFRRNYKRLCTISATCYLLRNHASNQRLQFVPCDSLRKRWQIWWSSLVVMFFVAEHFNCWLTTPTEQHELQCYVSCKLNLYFVGENFRKNLY